jgi:hypothetical protein
MSERPDRPPAPTPHTPDTAPQVARADAGASVQPTLTQHSQLPGSEKTRAAAGAGARKSRVRQVAAADVFKPRLAMGALLALGFCTLLWVLRGAIAAMWSGQVQWWLRQLDLSNAVGTNIPALHSQWLGLRLPSLELPMPDLGLPALLSHALAALVVWVVAGWWPDRARPLALLMRAMALLHGLAIAYFLLWPASFPHAAATHGLSGLRISWLLMLCTPWLHLGIHYLLPFALWQRLLLTLLSLLYLLLLTPLLVSSHLALLVLLGPVAMPLLHLLLGVALPLVGLVALYSWAISWGGGAIVLGRDVGVAGVPGTAGPAASTLIAPTLSQSLPPRF